MPKSKVVLRPCPFCNAVEGKGVRVIKTHPGTDWVRCESCGAEGPCQPDYAKKHGAKLIAIQAWNRRVKK
jgi:uncharacterized Zn finger protein